MRKKESVVTGIVDDRRAGPVRFIEYQPGNGTRYTLVFSRLLMTMHRTGYEEHATVVSWLQTGRCMVLAPTGYIAESYVAEKLDCREGDALVLAELFAHVTEREGPDASKDVQG